MKQLNSRDRVSATIRGQSVDRVAVAPYMYDIAARISGTSIRDFYTDPNKMVRAQLMLHDQLGQDVIAIGADNFYIAEGFGCQTAHEEDELPALIRPAVDSLDRVFEIEPLDPQRDGRMPVMLEAIAKTREAVGDEVALRSPGTGPFALASYLVGSQDWLMEVGMLEAGMSDQHEAAIHHALDVAAESLIRFGKACWDAGADLLHCGDSLASCDMISPSTYRRFAMPYQQKVFEAWKAHGVTGSLLHICGNSTKVLEDYAGTGADIIEVDTMVDLAWAREQVGDRVTLMGNVHTVDDLLHGNPDSVAQASKRCVADGRGGRGFILGSGCIVPRDTPIENLKAMVETARQ